MSISIAQRSKPKRASWFIVVVVLLIGFDLECLTFSPPLTTRGASRNHRYPFLPFISFANRRDFLFESSSAVLGTSTLWLSDNNERPQQQLVPNDTKIRIAFLGAGLFATQAHAPALLKRPEIFDCVAVWSRKLESAESLAAIVNNTGNNNCQAFGGQDGLDKLLLRRDVDAIIISLPLDVQPQYVLRALEAGKKVLSEKPIAATVVQGRDLVNEYREKFSDVPWSVGENFRYEPGIVKATEAVKSEIGSPYMVSLTIRGAFRPDNQFVNTEWRKDPSWYGGFFVDSFVHACAVLRMMIGDVKEVTALTTSQASHLPGVDTMVGHATFSNGVIGSFSITFAYPGDSKYEVEVTGSEGSVILQRRPEIASYRVLVSGKDPQDYEYNSIEEEFLAFAAYCQGDAEANKNTPDEALRDLALVEACLESGKQGGKVMSPLIV